MEIFAHHSDNKKRAGESRWPRLFAWAVAVVLVSSTLVIYLGWRHVGRLASRLSDSFLTHSYFSVKEIKVRGSEKVGGSEIVAMAGLSHGMNLWKIAPAAIEKKVEKHPWVKRVLVRREFPGRVVIEVDEREAKGIVVMGKFYYVDSDGVVFKEIEAGEKMNLPLLTGLQQADIASQSHSKRQKIQEALKLSELMEKGSVALSEIHFSPQGGVVLYPMATPVALHMGWGDWPEKLQRIERILEIWQGKESRLAALDVRFRDQVVARMRKPDGLKG